MQESAELYLQELQTFWKKSSGMLSDPEEVLQTQIQQPLRSSQDWLIQTGFNKQIHFYFWSFLRTVLKIIPSAVIITLEVKSHLNCVHSFMSVLKFNL